MSHVKCCLQKLFGMLTDLSFDAVCLSSSICCLHQDTSGCIICHLAISLILVHYCLHRKPFSSFFCNMPFFSQARLGLLAPMLLIVVSSGNCYAFLSHCHSRC